MNVEIIHLIQRLEIKQAHVETMLRNYDEMDQNELENISLALEVIANQVEQLQQIAEGANNPQQWTKVMHI